MGHEILTVKITFVRLHDFDVNVRRKIEADNDEDAKQTAIRLAKEIKKENHIECDNVRVLIVGDDGLRFEINDALGVY